MSPIRSLKKRIEDLEQMPTSERPLRIEGGLLLYTGGVSARYPDDLRAGEWRQTTDHMHGRILGVTRVLEFCDPLFEFAGCQRVYKGFVDANQFGGVLKSYLSTSRERRNLGDSGHGLLDGPGLCEVQRYFDYTRNLARPITRMQIWSEMPQQRCEGSGLSAHRWRRPGAE
jgi:hypothetical protein